MTAIVGFATGASVYTTAIEENIVLSIPSTALARAAALIPAGHELGLDVLLGLPCTVIDELDTAHARAVGALLQHGGNPQGDVTIAHIVHCAQERGWPVVTGDPQPLFALDRSIEIENMS